MQLPSRRSRFRPAARGRSPSVAPTPTSTPSPAAPSRTAKRTRPRPAVFAPLALVALLAVAADARASGFLGCMTGTNVAVPCTDPAAVKCADLDYPNGGSPACTSYGFTVSPDDTLYCVDMACSMSPTQVPELEDYAAAAFLILALTIGWQVRQRLRPVA